MTATVTPLQALPAPSGDRPAGPGDWPLSAIVTALSRELPRALLAQKTVGKGSKARQVDFLPWYRAAAILDKYAPGWGWTIDSIQSHPGQGDRGGLLTLTGTLSIPTADGPIARSATGSEELECSSYGDPSSNAESMAFRRAAAKFGLARYLYDRR